MFITVDLLKKHKACENGIKYIERFYPNGAEMIDIIRDKHINKEMLHWGREHLTHTPEELAAYWEACHIVNSDGIWYGQNIHNSKFVVKSKEVKGSDRVYHSEDVINSSDIVYGETISNSAQVFASTMVSNSSLIAQCNNITESKNICFSTMVSRSINIYNSKNVFGSSEIIKCDNVTDSYFCQDCKNIKHCMFCEGVEDAEYYLFNQPIDKERFELFLQQYKRFMQSRLAFAPEWPENLIRTYSPSISQKFDEWYKPIPEKFWKWARTLPGFDSMLLYNITMLPEILVD